jgi:hypothetical protein
VRWDSWSLVTRCLSMRTADCALLWTQRRHPCVGDLRTNETPRALLGALLQSTVGQNDVNQSWLCRLSTGWMLSSPTAHGLSTLSTSRITVGVWLLEVAALEPGVAPGRRTAVSTDPEIWTPGCGPYDEPAGAVAPRCVGIAR